MPPINRRDFLRWSAGGALSRADRPNVLLLITDQQRPDTLGCYGNTQIHTPNFDRLASGGALFLSAYCTTPVCSPARASILSGVYPHRHGVVDLWGKVPSFLGPVPGWPHPSRTELPWMGEMFQAAGYETAYCGKWHCLTGGRRPGFDHVLGRYGDIDIDSPEQNEFVKYAKSKGYAVADVRGHGSEFERHGENYGASIYRKEDHVAAFVFRCAQEFLDQPHEHPFLLVLSTTAPHDPYAPPKPYDAMYAADKLTLPPNVDVFVEQRRPIPLRSHPAERAWIRQASKEELRKMRAHYYGYVTYLDDLLGNLMNCLERNGLRQNTLIVVTSDHGDSMGSHRVENKGPYMYDGIASVPLLMSMSGRIRPQRVAQPVSGVDILPTLLDFAGIPDRVHLDGISLRRPLETGAGFSRGPVLSEYNRFYGEHFPVRAIITERYKYTHYFGPEGELFDRREDPFEMENLLYSPAHAGVLRQLRSELFKRMRQGGDPFFELLTESERKL